jgi:hypothetical protein
MGTALEGSKVARDRSARKRHVSIGLSRLAFKALTGDEADSAAEAPIRMESALRCYLGDKNTERPAWPYPGFLRGSEPQRDVEIEFEVEEGLWSEFEAEAATQEISVEQLAEHTAFYFAAEADAGRLTQRILEDLGSPEDD